MKTEFWLAVKARKSAYGGWVESGVKVTKKKPSTADSEVAVKVALDLPDALFSRPAIEAVITVPGNGIEHPVITAKMKDTIANVLAENLGVNVTITAEEKPPQGKPR